MNILFIFFDGWGLGAPNPEINPLLNAPLPTLRSLFDGMIPTNDNGHFTSACATLVPTDATLGIPGLPQSATGQTTIFTGVNAPREIGEHSGPYPNPALLKILAHDNLFKHVRHMNRRAAFANAYPPIFFERLARNKARRSATSHAVAAANVRYRDIDDLRQGDAVSVFVSNKIWVEHGANVPLITARDAGRNLARIAKQNDLTVFEYFLTDAAGHKANPQFTSEVLDEVDQLLGGILDEINLSETLVITTSDHGNIEDMTTKSHTLNPVPTMLIGAQREKIAPRVHALTDLTPAMVDLLSEK
ncbi:MAG: alkaline phosphatase family protein [Chloroflexi bacterium]|nr:alkaline phosphatase family protein [Chloroflexota bacterium]